MNDMGELQKANKRKGLTLRKVNIVLASAVVILAVMSFYMVHKQNEESAMTKTGTAPELASSTTSQSAAAGAADNPGMKPVPPPSQPSAPAVQHADGNAQSGQVQTAKNTTPNSTSADADKTDRPPLTAASITSKTVYLTFDDGPSKYTDQIVNILQNRHIHATFFMIGSQLKSHQKQINHVLAAGDYAGLHSMTHNYNKLYKSGGSADFIAEFKQEQALFKKMTGKTVDLIRAPYGSAPQIDKSFRDDIADAGFKMWDWTVDSDDWKYPDKPDEVIKQIKRQVHGNLNVILMHETKQTVEALPQIIAYLQNKGYSFAVYKPDQHVVVNFANDIRL